MVLLNDYKQLNIISNNDTKMYTASLEMSLVT